MNIPPEKIKILLADDHAMARAGIRAMLAQADDFEIVGEAKNGSEVFELVPALNPNILLLDLVMPGPRPAEIEKWVRENHAETITLVLTAHDRDAYLANMMDAGAAGYLDKSISNDGLIDAIRHAARGEILFDRSQITRARQWREDVGSKVKELTSREIDILKLLAGGADNKKIAATLNISQKTAAYHITNILAKLQLQSRQEAAVWVVKYLPDNLE